MQDLIPSVEGLNYRFSLSLNAPVCINACMERLLPVRMYACMHALLEFGEADSRMPPSLLL